MWIQTGDTVRKRLSWVMTSVTLTFDLRPWHFVWALHLSLVITSENFMMIWWWEHRQKGVTDRQTDGQTDRQTEGHKLGGLSGFTKMNIKWSSTFCPTRAYVVDHLIWTLSIELSGHLCVLQGFMWSICIPHRVWTKVSKLDSSGQLQSIP